MDSETFQPDQIIDEEYRRKMKEEQRGMAQGMQEELEQALVTLAQAKTEIDQEDWEAAWRTLAKVKSQTRGVEIAAGRLETALHLEADEDKRKERGV
ncbi:MAG TPA: hypothetical protein VJB37_01240 [Patescibacteria group bacterium]|nr:hypothetical protein [Patescibacteria group bacterium]